MHHYKTKNIIGSSGEDVTVYNGVYWVNDIKELDEMQHYDISVALKVTNMDNKKEYEKLVDQVNKTRHLDHPNLLLVKEDIKFEDKFWVVFLMMDGSLRCLMKSVFTNGIPEDHIAIVLKEVLEALANLHQKGHVHQELNASHIYYRLDIPAVKIGYLATIYEHNSGDDGEAFPGSLPASEICEWAAAPEIYHLKDRYTDKSDVWLVGITALELAFGEIQVKNRKALEFLIAGVTSKSGKKEVVGKYIKKMVWKMKICKSGSSSSSKKNDVTLSRTFKEMLALCFTEDAGKRPTAAALLEHDFFKICDGVFDVYDFRNAVMAERERGMLVGRSAGSDVAGISSGSNVAGASSGSNAVEGANP